MRRIKIFDPNNIEDFPEFSHIDQRVTKVELHFIDGTTKQMKLYFPYFTTAGESSEITGNYLSALVKHWTRYWLKLVSFQISLGSLYKDGTEHYSCHYRIQEIPLDKVYIHDWPNGEWVDPAEYEETQREKRIISMIKNMEEGKNALDGSQIQPTSKTILN